MPWLDIYMGLALFPAIGLAVLACVFLGRETVRVARKPLDGKGKP